MASPLSNRPGCGPAREPAKAAPCSPERAHIAVGGLRKAYRRSAEINAHPIEVLDDLTFEMARGEFVTFFGPNGCGKTTLLNVIAGLSDPDSGSVQIGGKAPAEARIGYIFQNYRDSLFPWRRVVDNIGLPLELEGEPRKTVRQKVEELLVRLAVDLNLSAYPYELSGGQQQLVAIARALVFQPDVLVMDEPFSALDYQTRFYMHDQLLRIWERTGTTVLFVSHEVEEAIYLADRVMLLSRRPARIVEVLNTPLPRPRRHEMIESEEFFRLKTRAVHVFREAIDN